MVSRDGKGRPIWSVNGKRAKAEDLIQEQTVLHGLQAWNVKRRSSGEILDVVYWPLEGVDVQEEP